jgi:hypothetical protein
MIAVMTMTNAISIATVLVASMAVARAATAPWVISQPAAWSDTTAEFEKTPDGSKARRAIEDKGGYLEMKVYSGPAHEVLHIAFTAIPDCTIEGITAWEDRAHKAATGRNTESSYRRDQQPRMIVSYQTVTYGTTTAYLRRISGIATDGAGWGVQAMCIASLAVCTPILDSLALDELRLIPLDSVAHSRSRGEQIGAIVGSIVGAIAIGWITIRLRRRSAKSLRS